MSELTAEYVREQIGSEQFEKVQTAIAVAVRENRRPVGHRPNAPQLTIEQAIKKVHGERKGYNVEIAKGSLTLGTAGLINLIAKTYHVAWVKGEPKKEKAV